jgi:nitrogenase molybdenum-iron protein alpha/beta subunit
MMVDEVKHLNRLSKVKHSKNIRFFTQAVLPGSYCPMRTGTNIAEDISGMSYLMVGMPECAIYSRSSTTLPEGANGELHYMYVLDQDEVVFGCREGVIKALKKMDEEGARAILMVATCVTDLIGEDLAGLITEVQGQVQAKLAYIMVGQFRNFSYQIGTWKVMEALGALVEPREEHSQTVNAVLIEPWRYGIEAMAMPPIIKAIEKRGVHIRRIAAKATLDDYQSAADSVLTLNLTTYSQPFADILRERHEVADIGLHLIFSVEEIDRAYERIENTLGISFEDEFKEIRGKALELEIRAKEVLNGLKYVFLRGVDMPIVLASYLAGFGMEPMLLQVEDILPQDFPFIKKLGSYGYDPPACRFMNMDLDIEILAKMGADLYFGQLPDPREDIKTVEEMYDFYGKVGYERTATLLERIITVYETGKMGGERYGA